MSERIEDKPQIIEIDPAADAAPAPAPAPAPALADPRIAAVDELKEQFEALKAKSEIAARERTEALRRAQEAEAEAQRTEQSAQQTIADSRLNTITTGISAAEAEATAAEEAWAAAMSAGDYAAAARAQRRMQRAEGNLARLEDAKSELAERPQVRRPPSDPVEAFIAGRTARTASWLRAHADHIVDPVKQRAMERAHFSALGEGLEPDTDEYFAHVETRLNLRQAAPAKHDPAPVAPVNAGGPAPSANSVRVSLTEGEQRAATDGTIRWTYDDPKGRFKKGEPIGTAEFARRKYIMRKEGAYDRNIGE